MKFKVYDNKTGKVADAYEIALHEDWARSIVYCDIEGFAITEDGDLVLMDECGNVVYCDTERFKVVFEEDRPHGEWIEHRTQDCFGFFHSEYECSKCHNEEWQKTEWHFCPNCGHPIKKEGDRNE